MDEKLKKILESIELSPEDSQKFGEVALRTIEKNKSLHASNNNFEYLRKFLSDTINFLETEIEYTKKYSSQIFHPNVAISREFEREIYRKILAMLEK